VFLPTISRERARRSALRQLLATFYDDSPEQVVATLLDVSAARLTDAEFDRLAELIDEARREGR
jgi:predicted transcriptional regulator